MKLEASDKMFIGCPYEDVESMECSSCPNYSQCLKDMQKIRAEEKQRIIKITLIAIGITTVVLIIAILAFGIALPVSKESSSNRSNKVTEQTTIPRIAAIGPSRGYYYKVSEEEKIMIAKLVWAEARGECYEGKVAVAAVVLNRYRFDENEYDFDNESIASVILQKNQFADISNITMQDLEEYPDCMKAVEDALKGWDPTRATFRNGALYFYAPKLLTEKAKEDREGISFMPIGNHNFHVNFEKVY